MALTDIFKAQGEDGFRELMRSISISRLKTYQLYDSLKARSRLPKLNVQGLKKVTPRFWERIQNGEEELASDLAQAILIGNFDLMIDVLNFLGVQHEDGFFDKDLDASEILAEGWQERAYTQFAGKYPSAVLLFYLNHLSWEITKEKTLFQPGGAA